MSIKILYYVFIAMQLQIIISFNTYSANSSDSYPNTDYTVTTTINYSLNDNHKNNINDDTNDIIDAELNNIIHDTTELSFITHWHLWDSSQPWGGYISISPLSFNMINLYLPLVKFSPKVKLFYGKVGIKITKSKFNRPYIMHINVDYIKTYLFNLIKNILIHFNNNFIHSKHLNKHN